jgi:hypothetical protein
VNKGLNDVSQRLVSSLRCVHSKVVACTSPWYLIREGEYIGIAHYRDGRDSRFADAGGIAERVAFCRYN